MPESTLTKSDVSTTDDRTYNLAAGAYLALVAGLGIAFGFGKALSTAKNKESIVFDNTARSLQHEIRQAQIMADANKLALRALGRGTLYAVGGFSLLVYSVCKYLGISDMKTLREKARAKIHRTPKNSDPNQRTEFENLTDLVQYLIDESERQKNKTAPK